MSKTTDVTPSVPVASQLPVQPIRGFLRWVNEDLNYGCRSIAIAVDGETEIDPVKNMPVLRGITLNREATKTFDSAFCVTILPGADIVVYVLTNDLIADMAAGIGIRGRDGKYFTGMSVSF
jgi:hypothetical protein